MTKKRIVVLVSGGGTGLQAIIDGCAAGKIEGQVCLVLSSHAEAYAVTRAEKAGIPTCIISKKDYPFYAACQAVRHEAIVNARPDIIVLAGFLGILPNETVAQFKNRIINIHPSLIPSFCGKGFHGRAVHEAVLKAGCKLSGCTVHFVSDGVDEGPIIAQKAVVVEPDDTPDTLADRVGEAERPLLAAVTAALCLDEIVVKNGIVYWKPPQ